MTSEQELKASIYEKIASISRALSSAPRLKIVQFLAQSPRSVEALSHLSGESIANTSQHLQKLLREGLVSCRKEGVSRIYQLQNREVLQLWENLQDLAHSVEPELNQAEARLTDATLHSPISAEEWLHRIQKGEASLLDVRESLESSATPVRHALCIPLQELCSSKSSLPHEHPIIVLCRGRYCSLASHAVRELREEGIEAYRLRESAYQINQLWEQL